MFIQHERNNPVIQEGHIPKNRPHTVRTKRKNQATSVDMLRQSLGLPIELGISTDLVLFINECRMTIKLQQIPHVQLHDKRRPYGTLDRDRAKRTCLWAETSKKVA